MVWSYLQQFALGKHNYITIPLTDPFPFNLPDDIHLLVYA
jgi:hypothetical protein